MKTDIGRLEDWKPVDYNGLDGKTKNAIARQIFNHLPTAEHFGKTYLVLSKKDGGFIVAVRK